MVFDQTSWFLMARTRKQIQLKHKDVSDLVQNGYEDLGTNPTEAQRLAFKEAKKKDYLPHLIMDHFFPTLNFITYHILL